MMRVATLSRKTRSWVMTMTAPRKSRISPSSHRMPSRSRWLVGSSSSSRSGSATSARQRHALDAAAGEAGNLCRRVESESGDHLLDALVEPPAARGLDRMLQAVQPGHGLGAGVLGDLQHGGVVVDEQAGGGAQAVGDGLEDVAPEFEIRLLRHVCRDHFSLPPHCAIIERRLAGERAQKAGLARAVAPDERHALPGVELEAHVIEQVDVTEGEAGVIYGEERHLGGHGARAAGRIGGGDSSPALAALGGIPHNATKPPRGDPVQRATVAP